VIVEMQERRERIEGNVMPGSAIIEASEAVGPRIEERDSGSASLGFGGFQIINAAEKFSTAMTQRNAQHARARPKLCVQVTCNQGAS
jgi:hypothetical protein